MVKTEDFKDTTLIDNAPQKIEEFFIAHDAGNYITAQTAQILHLFSFCETQEYDTFHSISGQYHEPLLEISFDLQIGGNTPGLRFTLGTTYESKLIIPNSRTIEFFLLKQQRETMDPLQMLYFNKQILFCKGEEPKVHSQLYIPFRDPKTNASQCIIQYDGCIAKLNPSYDSFIATF